MAGPRRERARAAAPGRCRSTWRTWPERHRIEAERAAALDRSNRLLEKPNHRVMDGPTMTVAMEGRALGDAECRRALERMSRRIASVAALYRNLARAGSVDTVAADACLAGPRRGGGRLDRRGEAAPELSLVPVPLSMRLAVPLGLIANDLVANSLRHALDGRAGARGSPLLTRVAERVAFGA